MDPRSRQDTFAFKLITYQERHLRNEPLDIYPNMPCTVDFLRTDERENRLAASPGISWPYILENVFDDKGTYRFTITVNCEGVSKSKTVEIDWDSQWDTISGR